MQINDLFPVRPREELGRSHLLGNPTLPDRQLAWLGSVRSIPMMLSIQMLFFSRDHQRRPQCP